jgi:hypothetical protein
VSEGERAMTAITGGGNDPGGHPLADGDRRRDHEFGTGRPTYDHPDTEQQHRQEVARLAARDRQAARREEAVIAAAVADDGLDTYDKAELDYRRMEAEEVGQRHPNEWGG